MIKSKLNIILAERDLSISDLSKRTGVSRTTLTSLTKNHSAGIQYDTLNKICMHLRIQPKDLFEYLPFDIEVRNEHTSKEENEFIVKITITTSSKIESFFIMVNVSYSLVEKNNILQFDLTEQPYLNVYLSKFINETAEHKDENDRLDKFLELLTPTFLKDFENMLIDEVKSFANVSDEEVYKIHLDWDYEDFPMLQ